MRVRRKPKRCVARLSEWASIAEQYVDFFDYEFEYCAWAKCYKLRAQSYWNYSGKPYNCYPWLYLWAGRSILLFVDDRLPKRAPYMRPSIRPKPGKKKFMRLLPFSERLK